VTESDTAKKAKDPQIMCLLSDLFLPRLFASQNSRYFSSALRFDHFTTEERLKNKVFMSKIILPIFRILAVTVRNKVRKRSVIPR